MTAHTVPSERTPEAILAAAKHAHALGFTPIPIGRKKKPHFDRIQRLFGDNRWSRLRGLAWEEVEPVFEPIVGFPALTPTGWAIEWKEHTGCFDFDDREVWDVFVKRAREAKLGKLIDRCLKGYSVITPRGQRFAVTCRAGVPGGQKLAARYTGEVDERGRPKTRELIGLKGRGLYTIEVPSYDVHPLGDYGPQTGKLETIAKVSAEELQQLLDIANTLDETGGPRATVARAARLPGAPGEGITAEHRWRREMPCPVCGGVQQKGKPQGHCFGFRHPGNASFIYCSEVESPTVIDNGAYLHRLQGKCPCGVHHGAVYVEKDGEQLQEDLRALTIFEELRVTYVRGNKNIFAWDDRGQVHRQSKQYFYESFQQEWVRFLQPEKDASGKPTGLYTLESMKAAKFWFERCEVPTARKYTYNASVPFMDLTPGGEVNLWRGFSIAPREGSIELFRAHLLRVCSGRRPVADYLWKLIAWKLQNPTKPTIVIVVIHGPQGTGKTTIARAIERVFHSMHTVELHDEQVLKGDFNALLEGRAFVFFDEALFLQDPRALARLKTTSSAPELKINEKYVPSYSVPNLASVMIFTNARHVSMSTDDRRFLLIEADPSLRRDYAYFDRLYAEIESTAFPAALLHAALEEDLEGWAPERNRPETIEMEAARALNLRPIEKWASAELCDGGCVMQGQPLGSPLPWDGLIERNELRARFEKFLKFSTLTSRTKDDGDPDAQSKVFAGKISALWGIDITCEYKKHGKRHFGLPSRDDARKRWQGETGIERDDWTSGR